MLGLQDQTARVALIGKEDKLLTRSWTNLQAEDQESLIEWFSFLLGNKRVD